ncbi:MBL fold metallo-hydrolase [Marinicauda algicola]|uniref:MBL fold metallo-hydrolase n=1 Tax=Marinicauda algicola TaxID=2029849 RepID=A0A4S2GXL5_9PROT|nr:MBL fold metallo-hydrolase [Marinicauda algicola]TGY87887.1 MBL fold metallo-hydrolase [Marinicauda algicola]
MPAEGDVVMRWAWSGYRAEASGAVPERLTVTLNGRMLKDAALSWRAGADPALFEAPEGMEFPAPPGQSAGDPAGFIPYGERPARVETIAPGVHLVRNLRPGFHVPFVEFDSFVVAIDAPTLWNEMHYLPPVSGSPGDDVHALGEKLLRAIEATAPGKPVRHLVLTHHHSDHIGGARALIEAGADILAGRPAAEAARTIIEAPYTREPYPLTRTPQIEIVDAPHTIEEGDMELRLIPLPPGNPKADGFLVVYLPRQRLIYATAFLYPVPESVFPLVESVPLSAWFVDWLDGSGLAVDEVWNLHGTGRVEDWQLEYFREPGAAD